MDPKPEPPAVEPWDVTTPLDDLTHELAHAKKGAFLGAFAKTGNITIACHAARVGRRTHYEWMDSDELYARAFAEAQKVANDYLLAEARRRAVQGSRRYKFHEGQLIHVPAEPGEPGATRHEQQCEVTDEGAREKYIETSKGTKTVYIRDVWMKPYEEMVYSDTLLMFLMKAEDEKFRETKGADKGSGDGILVKRIEVAISDVHEEDLPYLHRITGVAPAHSVYDPKTGQIVNVSKPDERGAGGTRG